MNRRHLVNPDAICCYFLFSVISTIASYLIKSAANTSTNQPSYSSSQTITHYITTTHVTDLTHCLERTLRRSMLSHTLYESSSRSLNITSTLPHLYWAKSIPASAASKPVNGSTNNSLNCASLSLNHILNASCLAEAEFNVRSSPTSSLTLRAYWRTILAISCLNCSCYFCNNVWLSLLLALLFSIRFCADQISLLLRCSTIQHWTGQGLQDSRRGQHSESEGWERYSTISSRGSHVNIWVWHFMHVYSISVFKTIRSTRLLTPIGTTRWLHRLDVQKLFAYIRGKMKYRISVPSFDIVVLAVLLRILFDALRGTIASIDQITEWSIALYELEGIKILIVVQMIPCQQKLSGAILEVIFQFAWFQYPLWSLAETCINICSRK